MWAHWQVGVAHQETSRRAWREARVGFEVTSEKRSTFFIISLHEAKTREVQKWIGINLWEGDQRKG